MQYNQYQMNGYRLFVQKTNKFKTIQFSTCLKIPISRYNSLYLGMLSTILKEGTKDYPTSRLLDIKCAEIYDPMYYVHTAESGKYMVLRVGGSFINEKYTEKGMNLKAIQFILDLIFKPNIQNNSFDEQTFQHIKNILKTNIESEKENPKKHANEQICEMLDKKSTWGYTSEEILADLEKATAKELFIFYQKFIKECEVDAFIIGNINPSEIQQNFNKILTLDNEIKNKDYHFDLPTEFKNKFIQKKEDTCFKQSIINMGYKIKDLSSFERNYVKSLYVVIINRILFDEIREKHSLCYYVSMNSRHPKDILIITAGIDPGNYQKTIKLIKEQLENIKQGKITKKQIDVAKKIYINSLLSIEDIQKRMLNAIESHEYINTDLLENRKTEILKVNKKQIIAFANKIHEDSIFILEGEQK